MADNMTPREALIGGARGALGQGLGMGWGDEAEAWLRSRLGQGSYEDLLKQIRGEYGTFAEKAPITSFVSELGGGVLPGAAMMFVPGGQPAGAAQITGTLSRLAARPITKAVATGATTGVISGAGSATEESRGTGALIGGGIGAAFGAALPPLIRGGSSFYKWAAERLAPSSARSTERAAQKFTEAMGEARLTPQQIEQAMRRDRAMGVPSTVANVDPALADLAETLAQRTGRGTRKVEQTLTQQQSGGRERVYQQARKGLQPGEFYAEEERLMNDLRSKAAPAYQRAYAFGEVDDPQIMEMLALPQFKGAWDTARKIADSDAAAAQVNAMRSGQPFDPNAFKLRDIYKVQYDPKTGAPIDVEVAGTVPDVRTLDYMKRALDAQITAGYKSDNAATLASASAMKDLRNALRDRTKEVVPEYRQALDTYAGDREILDALQSGYRDFGKLDHEEVAKLIGGMTNAEKDAFRTGVVRDLYSKIFTTSRNINAAALLESPETKAKMQVLFDSPAHYRLFEAAVARESQLFKQANQILRGSQTGKRTAMREKFEGDESVTQAAAQALTGGWMSSLTGMASRALYKTTMTEEMADKLAGMLMSKSPQDVADVVRVLEKYAERAVPRQAAATSRELGATSGAAISAFPAPPATEKEPGDIEKFLSKEEVSVPGRDIEEFIRQMDKRQMDKTQR